MTNAGTCIFLNGLPGSGKSTYARRFVDGRRGWLNLDVDLMRGLLGTASVDFGAAGAEVQPLALAVLREHISLGRNVIFPQLFFVPEEAAEFEAIVRDAGGRVIRSVLHEDVDECWRRVEQRGSSAPSGSLDRSILDVLTHAGGIDELRRAERQLAAWQDLGDPPRIITGDTAFNEVAGWAA